MFDALKRHWDAQKQQPIMALFEAQNRAEQFSVQADDLLLDYSKTQIDAIARKGLLGLAQARGLERAPLRHVSGRCAQ